MINTHSVTNVKGNSVYSLQLDVDTGEEGEDEANLKEVEGETSMMQLSLCACS